MALQHDADPVDPAAADLGTAAELAAAVHLDAAPDGDTGADGEDVDAPDRLPAVARRVRAAWCFLVSGLG